MRDLRTVVVALIVTFLSGFVGAAELEGVRFDDTTTVAASELVLNGVGVRSRFGKRYVIALYLPARTSDANAAVSAKGAKRVAITLVKDISGSSLSLALLKGVENNSSASEMAALKERLRQWSEMVTAIEEIKAGATILLDWTPGKGTLLTINGQAVGKEIPGDDFYAALLRVWLGAQPVQDDLKRSLLGLAS